MANITKQLEEQPAGTYIGQQALSQQTLGSLRFDWLVTLTAVWFIGGLYLDGWAHNNIGNLLEDFFTPWHAAFYSGFMAVTAVHGWAIWQNHRRGHAWQQSLPVGYDLSLLGIVVFALSGVGDLIWHELFGIETDISALFSPTHLLLIAGMTLIVTGPIRAAGHRRNGRQSGWAALFPLLLSHTFLLSLLTFITQFAYFLTAPWVATSLGSTGFTGDASQILGISSTILQTGLLMGLLLPILRRWALPPGTITLLLGTNILLMGIMLDEFMGVPAMVLTGVVGDGLLVMLSSQRLLGQRPLAFRLYAFLLPFILYSLYLFTIVTNSHTWWSTHLLTGIPIFAGVTGLLLSYLVLPPPSLRNST